MTNYCDKGHWEAQMTLPCKQCEIDSLRQQLADSQKREGILREGMNAINTTGVERSNKWIGMSARDIARITLAATPDPKESK